MKQVLLVEDDPKLSRLLASSLRQDGYEVESALCAADLDRALQGETRYKLVVLDRLIGQTDTRHRIKEIRKSWPSASILVVSAINTPMERAELINEGADDYLGKPFYTEELLARLRSLARRMPEGKESGEKQRQIGRAVFDLQNRRLSASGKFEELSQKEFLLLNVLSEDRRVISRPELLETVLGDAETNLVEATVANLRKKISRIESGFEIKNQRNLGYWIEG